MATAAPAAPTANKAELLAIADAVAREKLIDKAIVIEAMEDAIQRAARARYGAENDIRAKLDQNTGELRLWRVLEVVEEPEDHFKQVDVKGAQKLDKSAKLGDFIVDPLPPIEFGRIAAQAAKQVIFQKVRDAERERQFEEFKERAGEIITGVVKRVEFGHVVVDLGRAEGVIRRDAQDQRADAVADTDHLARDLRIAANDAFGAAEVDDDVAELHPLDDAGDDLAGAILELFILPLALGVADLLEDDLLGGLGGDAAEFDRRQRIDDIVADDRAGLELLGVLEADLLEMIVDLFGHLDDAPQPEVARGRVELGADVVLGAVAGAGGALDRILHRLDHDHPID